MTIDIDRLRALIDVLVERDIAEFEHEAEGVRTKIVRTPRVAAFPSPGMAFAPFWVADQAGYFAEAGYEATHSALQGGALVLAALTAGEILLAPRGVPHTYRVESPSARWLTMTGRRDFERFVRSFGQPAEHEGLPEPSGPLTPEQVRALEDACRRHNIQIVGPPLQ